MRGLVLALAVAWLTTGSAAAGECTHIKGFTINLTPVEDGYLMPIGIAGTPRQFLLELGAAYPKMDEAIAAELKLPTKSMPHGMRVVDSDPYTKIAVVPTLTIGPVTRKDAEVLIGAHRSGWGPVADGVATNNLFYGLDIELDLAHNRLGLYLPREGCAFEPFWPSVEWGSGDFRRAPTGGTYLQMSLDDKTLIVTFDMTEERTYMPFETAHTLFGIEENDPRLIPAETRPVGEGKLYRFAFKSLSGGNNVTIDNPEIYIDTNQKTCGGARELRNLELRLPALTCFGGGDLQLGNNLLKKLHFFFSFKDKKVYYTLAEPPASK